MLKVFVTVDVLSLARVLELVRFDVLPQGVDDEWPCLSVDAQQSSQAVLKFIGTHLVVQHKQNFALHILISWPLDLKSICLLGAGGTVPL
ncbi:hypothetical protein EGW08_008923 [Elysia chlorotica]|uniref:Uncharacterized protein n=1 Tax=Elysia chlorotica TaxID=188477 RepID=A0A433TP36_ELYCH|nr:hypothetical protein EGW08_008923 [Elysia chlorotica]